MAEFEKKKHAQDEFNNGNKYVANDGVQPATINNLVENSLYTEAFAESLASTPDTTNVSQVGTPSVELVDNPSAGITGAKKFKFSNLKGEAGRSIIPAENGNQTITYEQLKAYAAATSQTYTISNSLDYDIGDVAIISYTISDRDNTRGSVFVKVTGRNNTLIVGQGLGMSVAGSAPLFYNGYLELAGGSIEGAAQNGVGLVKANFNRGPEEDDYFSLVIKTTEIQGDYTVVGENGTYFCLCKISNVTVGDTCTAAVNYYVQINGITPLTYKSTIEVSSVNLVIGRLYMFVTTSFARANTTATPVEGEVFSAIVESDNSAAYMGLFQVSGSHGAQTSCKLLSLARISGDAGAEVELRATDDYIQWKYDSSSTWTNLVSLSALKGDDGKNVELQKTADYIQWRNVGDGAWIDLVALSDLKGEDGKDGVTPLEYGEIYEDIVSPWIGQPLSLEALNREPIQNETVKITYRHTGTDKMYGVLAKCLNVYPNYVSANVIDYWNISGEDGNDGVTPHIGNNGNWFIGNQDTNVKAEGKNGNDGTNGLDALVVTGLVGPYVETGTSDIGLNIVVNLNRPPQAGEEVWLTTESYTMERDDEGSVVYIETGNVYSILVEFEDGSDFQDSVYGKIKKRIKISGDDGITPHIGVDGFWYIGETNTNVIAEGQDGEDGVSPHIGSDGYWYIGDTNTNVKAEGAEGLPALAYESIVNAPTDSYFNNGVRIPLGALNRTPLKGEYVILAWRDTDTNKLYLVGCDFPDGDSYGRVIHHWQISGEDGTNGTDGKDGVNGQDGADGAAATIQIGEVITGDPGTNASVENTGTENAAILNFTIPRGATGTPGANGQDGAPGADGKDGATFTPSVDTNGNLSWSNNGNLPNPETVNLRGAQGEAATVQVGQVTTLPAGSQATVTNSGTNQAAVLNFGIPTGATGADGTDGAAATIEVGEVTTGAAGTQASVTNSGTTSAAVLDFTIPKGADGASGVTDVTAGSPTEQDGYTVTPVTFNFEQGNSKTVNIQAKNGEGAGVQQNAIINRTASVTTADANSPDFVENNGDLWVKRLLGYAAEVDTLSATLPSARRDASAVTAPNGKIYVFGEFGSIAEFDPITQSVTTLEVTLPDKQDTTSAATAPNGKIYVFGGRFGLLLDNIVEFDPVTQAATTLEATLPSARESTSAATAPNGKIYVFGGQVTNANYLDDIIEFDPVAQTVTTLEVTLPDTGILSAVTAPNGKIYVFGESGSIAEFDPITQSVTTLEVTLPDKQDNTSAATAPNGKIYVFGGFKVGSGALDNIVEFDPVTQSVTTLEATLPSGRYDTSVATAPNGKIYVFGGFGHDDIEEFSTEAQYAYSPAVVLSQAEYTQLKNILQGIFAVGISTPSATINGTLSAGNTTVNGAITASGAVTAPSFNATT